VSSSSYYSIRQRHLAELAAVEGKISSQARVQAQLSALRDQLKAAITCSSSDQEYTPVADVELARATTAVLEAIDVEALAARAQTAQLGDGSDAEGAIDLSGLLAPRFHTTEEYRAAVVRRVKALFPLTSTDDERIARALALVDEVAELPLAVAQARLDPVVADLTTQLRESETASIEETYFAYLAACALAKLVPQRLPLLSLRSETQRIVAELERADAAEDLHNALQESLTEAGLTVVGGSVLNGQAGVLIADPGDSNAALFLVEGEDSLLFTTVVAEPPDQQSHDRRAAVRRSVDRLCSKKKHLIDEALAARGIILDTAFDHLPDAVPPEFSADFATRVAEASSAQRSGNASGVQARRAEA
jgi:hypothetical protein